MSMARPVQGLPNAFGGCGLPGMLWVVPSPVFLSFSILDSELCYLRPWHQHSPPPPSLHLRGVCTDGWTVTVQGSCAVELCWQG